MVLPFDGGEPIKTFDVAIQDVVPLEASLSWAADSKAVTYVTSTGGSPNLWSQALDGGGPKRLTDFKENGVWRYASSHDSKLIAFARGAYTSDAVLIKDFKQALPTMSTRLFG